MTALAPVAPFLWGAGTSAHQVEGGTTGNDWAEWEAAGRLSITHRILIDRRLSARSGHRSLATDHRPTSRISPATAREAAVIGIPCPECFITGCLLPVFKGPLARLSGIGRAGQPRAVGGVMVLAVL
jgi:hypothetical protein